MTASGEGLPPISERTRFYLERAMVKLPFVIWDRWAGRGDWAQAFGWILRTDGRSDFVVIESSGSAPSFTTSSAEWSACISELLAGPGHEHNECRRIERDFPNLANVVRLSGTTVPDS